MKWLKSQWKALNSTPERGFEAEVLHFFHRVFNLWKKQDPFTTRIWARMLKTFPVPAGPGMGPKGPAHTLPEGSKAAAKPVERAGKKLIFVDFWSAVWDC